MTTSETDMARLLAYGQFDDLNGASPQTEKALLLRLHRLPDFNDTSCRPETDAFCAWQYFLSASTFDEVPEVAIYRLPIHGEVLSVQWQETATKEPDTARLLLRWQERVQSPGDSPRQHQTLLEITPDRLRILAQD